MTTDKEEIKKIEKFNHCLIALNELARIQVMISKRELKIRKRMKKLEVEE